MAHVDVESRGPVCLLTLRREEKLNALSAALEAELDRALASAPIREARAVVLAGAGRAFCAGADVTEFRDQDAAAIMRYYDGAGNLYERLAALPAPTVAALHGYCLGGGLELALACDFRVVEEPAQLGFPEARLGIIASSGGTHRLVRLVGPARAKELLLLRDRFTAAEGLALGLVTEVVPEGSALARALELAERLAGLPGPAARLTKRAIRLVEDAPRASATLVERFTYGLLAQTPEADEAARGFVERPRTEEM
ncbi:MAG: enoyl-CoA hydratase/isomerase family protein [Thermoleophilia bacterium]|nr:enoyl-CoA hydratase/isomerase family protein [Thermoleophilia bacterium]